MAGIEMSLATPAPESHSSKSSAQPPNHRKMLHKHDTFPKSSISRPSALKQDTHQPKVKIEKTNSSRQHHKTLLLQELELLKETLKEKDDLIKLFQQENETLQNKQVMLPKFVTMGVENSRTLKKDGDKMDYRLQQLRFEIENKETLIKSFKNMIEQLGNNKDIDSSIHQAELEYKVAVEESSLLTLKHQYSLVQSEINIQESPTGIEEHPLMDESFYSFITRHSNVMLFKAEIPNGCFGRYGFGVSACTEGKGICIELVNGTIPLRRGDRLLEVNNHSVFNMSEREFKQLMSGLVSPLHVVVLRVNSPDTLQELNSRVERLENDKISLTCENKELSEDLRTKTEIFQNAWTELKDFLTDMKNDLDKETKKKFSTHSEDTHLKNLPIHSLHHLEAFFEAKDLQLQDIVGTQTKTPSIKMDRIEPDGTEKNGDCQDRSSPPIWESLKFSKKEEILTALRNQILESSTQKVFLDGLLALVIDHAPHLLSLVTEKETPTAIYEESSPCEEAWC